MSESSKNHATTPSVAIARPAAAATIHSELSSSLEKANLIPSPFLARRNRTYSATRSATEGPTLQGVLVSFCKARGHGFIQPAEPENSGEKKSQLFLHISDVNSEYVPMEGDKVTYKLAPIPPTFEKFQAVEVEILNLDTAKHHRWNQE